MCRKDGLNLVIFSLISNQIKFPITSVNSLLSYNIFTYLTVINQKINNKIKQWLCVNSFPLPDTSQMLLTFQPKSLHPLFPENNSSRTPLSAFKRKKKAKQASNELGRNKIPTKGWLTIFFLPLKLIQATSILNPLEGVKMKVFLFSLQNTQWHTGNVCI